MATTNSPPATPTMPPPRTERDSHDLAVGVSEPKPPGAADLAVLGDVTDAAAPTLFPPGTAAAAGQAVGGVTATLTSGTVTGMWSPNEIRNAWMLVGGAWKKLYNGRDGAFTALVTLASQARQTGRTIQYRQEADGMVYEIYLW